MLVSMLGAGVFAGYVRFSPHASHVVADQKHSEPDVTVTEKPDEPETKKPAASTTTLLIPAIVKNDIQLGKELGTPPDGVRPEVFLVNATLQSLQIDGARAVGIDVHNHVAMLDLNPATQKGYGTIEEGYLIKALQMALGQFKDINKFQVVIEGKPIDSFGNIDLSAPLDVIRSGGGKATEEKSNEPPTP